LKFQFRLVGWVLMPEHFHILFQPVEQFTWAIVEHTKQLSAGAVLKALREGGHARGRLTMLRALRLPASVHDHATHRVWQRRFVPFGVLSEKEMHEKLDYMHNNPVKRRLVASPADWPWSSWRFYYLGDRSVLEMDPLG
jgi:putative transposase